MSVVKVCPFNVVHRWDTDRIPLCNMSEMMEYTTERKVAKMKRTLNTSTTGTYDDYDYDYDEEDMLMMMINDD